MNLKYLAVPAQSCGRCDGRHFLLHVGQGRSAVPSPSCRQNGRHFPAHLKLYLQLLFVVNSKVLSHFLGHVLSQLFQQL